MTLFTRSQQGWCRRRVAVFCMLLRRRADRACLRPDIEPTSDALSAARWVRRRRIVPWQWCSLVWRNILSSRHMFRGHGKDSQQRQFQLVVELICQKTGGPCAYIGRPMTPVHDGLGISEANWTTFMKIISDGMDEKKYPSDVRDEFLAMWRSFHDGVVQK